MKVIGIDLGTSNSCVAVYRKNQVEIIDNDQGERVTPSWVSFTDDERLIGNVAKQEVSSNFERTFFQIKRLIGRTYDDPMVQADMKLWGFNLIDEDNKPKISIEYRGRRKIFDPEEISAMILEYLKTAVEDRLDETITDAVITVPAYFNNTQRNATIDAGRIAGLNVLRVINEPTAAAIAYGLEKETNEEQNILVFDLGGGTFDVTIVRIKNKIFDVKATGGDTHLGGDDFDNRMVNLFVSEFNRKNDCDMSLNKHGINRLRIACENAKKNLSVKKNATVQVDGLHNGIDFRSSITRAKFDELNRDYFEKTFKTVKDALTSADMDKSEIDKVVLVGGSTRIPNVRNLLQDFFGEKKISKNINPDEAVAYGAAALASNISKEGLSGIKDLKISDVVPLSLGLRQSTGGMSIVVKRNTKIPTEKWKVNQTALDYQTESSFSIFEGERAAAKDNHFLGKFWIKGIPAALRGVEKFKTCFIVDENGILTVTSRNVSTGKENQITFDNSGKLSEREIRRMLEDANRFKQDDAEWKERREQAHKLENAVYAVKHAVTGEMSLNVSDKDKKKIIKICKKIINWMNDNQNPPIQDSQREMADLEKICKPIFKKIRDGSEILRIFQK
ncbi:heat shock cognate 71 kDa protein-like [Styela clava]|uniref:heat shock 70 kDa protein II-like n=1 Tax=Styela clava TaxID=7725 RepID=UPI00193A122C|nr:heat shock 70 kDa protein II-like [Styela clava]